MELTALRWQVAEIDTSIGTLCLYRASNNVECRRILAKGLEQEELIRAILPHIAYFSPDTSPDQKGIAVTPDQAEQLSDTDLEMLVKAYVSSEKWKGNDQLVRGNDEPAIAFMDRFLRKEIEAQQNEYRKLVEGVHGSTRGIFDQVRESSLALGETLRQFEQLSKASEHRSPTTAAFETKSFVPSDPFAERNARLARERAEDREMIRLTGQMSAQSAKTLQELAGAASTMLEKLDQRDEDDKRTTRTQLRIAVWSVGISALFSILALIVSIMAYYQDRANTVAGDTWQVEVLDEMKASNKHGASLLADNKVLQNQVKQLGQAVKALENKASPYDQRLYGMSDGGESPRKGNAP